MQHYNIFAHFLKDKLREIYLNVSLQAFALALVSVFVPIYLLDLGYSLNEVLWFILVKWLVFGLASPLSAIVSSKIGFKHVMLFRLPLDIAALLLLGFIGDIGISIYLIAFLIGLSFSLYVIPMASLFARYSHKLHRGMEVGKLVTFPHLAAVFSPLIGGWIASYFGFSILFIVASLILFLSVVPLFFSREMKPHVTFSFRKMEHFLKEDLGLVLGFMAGSIRQITLAVIVPLFVYLALGNIKEVGYVATLLLVGTAAFNLFIGKISDKYGNRLLFRVGGLLSFVVFLFFLFVNSLYDFMIISFFGGMAFALLQIPFEKKVYNEAAKHNVTEFLVYKELMLTFFRTIYLLVLILVVDKFFVAFGVASLTSLVYLLI
tara:strand:+ start:2825 stop:3952 length:1128 start_codon:yes stop_codon:yes gene_type:complete